MLPDFTEPVITPGFFAVLGPTDVVAFAGSVADLGVVCAQQDVNARKTKTKTTAINLFN
jgi:hypothetical protein